MNAFSHFVTKRKWLIISISLLLLIPSIIGYKGTKINYDLVSYLPKDVETMKGQNILTKDFKQGAFAVVITEGMNAKQILSLEEEIKKVDSVNKVGSVYDIIGYSIPIEILPKDVVSKVKKNESNLIIVTFTESTSDDKTLNAIREIKKMKSHIKVSGMSATTLDTAEIAEKEVFIYVLIAVILCLLILMISLDSYFVPFLLLGNIGVAILYNMGSNIFFGQISYITKAIAAVLQLGVTTDFSIFLYHKYESWKKVYDSKDQAMEMAIKETIVSVVGSSLTTVAGFLALCTMTLTLGTDIGLVMAKGVVFGVITVLTLFPALVLVCDKIIYKTAHKVIIPEFIFIKSFVIKYYKVIMIVFLVGLVPAYYGQAHTQSYYNLTSGLPKELDGVKANDELKKKFKIVSPYFVMVSSDLSSSSVNHMINKFNKISGIEMTLSLSKLAEAGITEDMLSDDIKSMVNDGKHQMILLSSKYETATSQLNDQITKVNAIAKSYDKNAIVCGEGPLMKDMVTIADTDFTHVNISSILVVFIIMIVVLKSFSLPILLVAAIEFAIFINMGIPYFTGVKIPFVASIVIGTIQLGATIDYAILMSTKYLEVRKDASKEEAVGTAISSSVNSIFVSAMCFFGATVGVGLYSNMDMISSICMMISRGALISMITVAFIVPALLLTFDKLIIKTTKGFRGLSLKEEM
ncbi:efflux RND transporter permease subunit [Eggerthia catenaformis]|uniref:efflux RND transporter permease subunit n=1 Tax=Eggerthia catenaformis TaxID=31973 RepID=UPI000559426A|nr:MMPL family transporter [Eggerthia catenaformis]